MTAKKKLQVREVDKIWLSAKEAAKYLGVSAGYIAELRKDGLLKHCMVRNTAFFLKQDIDNFIESNRVY